MKRRNLNPRISKSPIVSPSSQEDGFKIELFDKDTDMKVVLGMDSAVDVVLLKIVDNFQKYNKHKLLETYKFIKSSFLCFLDKEVDLDYLVASILNAKNGNHELLTQYALNSAK